MAEKARKQRRKEAPVTLHPLDPKEALADLMKVKKPGKAPRSRSRGDRGK